MIKCNDNKYIDIIKNKKIDSNFINYMDYLKENNAKFYTK